MMSSQLASAEVELETAKRGMLLLGKQLVNLLMRLIVGVSYVCVYWCLDLKQMREAAAATRSGLPPLPRYFCFLRLYESRV